MIFQSTFRKGECETEKIKPEALKTLNPGVGLYFSKFLESVIPFHSLQHMFIEQIVDS